METITIIRSRNEPRIISPGVRQGRTYSVIDRGPDYFKVRVRGKPVLVDMCLVDLEPDDVAEEDET